MRTDSISSDGGRPFTANDLLAGAKGLKKVNYSPDHRKTAPEESDGLMGTLNRALLNKFGNAIQSEDSEEEFDEIDDEWDD